MYRKQADIFIIANKTGMGINFCHAEGCGQADWNMMQGRGTQNSEYILQKW